MKISGKKVILIAIAAVVIALGAAAFVTLGNTGSDPAGGAVSFITKPLKVATSAISDKISSIHDYFSSFDSLKAENDELRSSLAEYQNQYVQYVDAMDENKRLRSLLNLSRDNPSYEYAEADIIAWSASSWNSSFTIANGTGAGIEKGDCVIDEYGSVIGKITEVNSTSATVTTIIDTTSSFGAKVTNTGAEAVAGGKLELFEDKKISLTHLEDNDRAANGSLVITAGIGGAYPPGLIVGTITGYAEGSSALYDYAIITPAASFDSLTTVFVITSY